MNESSRMQRQGSMPGSSYRADEFLTSEELAAAAGITVEGLARLVRLGLVEPVAFEETRYRAATAARVRRMLRLRVELGVNLIGAAIIIDLLDRLERRYWN